MRHESYIISKFLPRVGSMIQSLWNEHCKYNFGYRIPNIVWTFQTIGIGKMMFLEVHCHQHDLKCQLLGLISLILSQF